MRPVEDLSNMKTHSKTVLQQLSDYPALSKTFKHCLEFDYEGLQLDFAVKGSLVTGEVDALSDIDLYINVPDASLLGHVQNTFVDYIEGFTQVLTWFRAEHINMPNLLVFYLVVDGEMIKLDVEIICLQQQPQALPEKFLALKEHTNIFESQEKETPQSADFEFIHRKFCAWQWFIYCKIARGELFQAARSIDFSRENALLVIIRKHFDLEPFDGHRRIEQLLPSDTLTQLFKTYPNSLTKEAMLDSLTQLSNMFEYYWGQFIQSTPVVHDAQLLEIINEQISNHFAKHLR
ncbi:hypothetical protein PSOS111911_20155 [Pseudoalteromonas ostreae]